MLESLLAQTSLPSFHPAVVHFPIVLLVIALLTDVVALARHRSAAIAHFAAALWVSAALASFAAQRSGGQAEDLAGIADPKIEEAIEDHEEWAERTTIAAIGVAVLRLGLAVVTARRGRPLVAVHAAIVAIGLVPVGLITVTADKGGALVYRHGVGVVSRPPAAPVP
jgi:uncharacterized membrane protein